MPCNPLDTLRRLLLSQQSSAPHGGWVRRGERENNEEKSDHHHDQGDRPKRLRLSPELEVFSLSVGPRQPDNPNQRHQREQALERSLADQADNLTAKRGAGNKKVNAVQKIAPPQKVKPHFPLSALRWVQRSFSGFIPSSQIRGDLPELF